MNVVIVEDHPVYLMSIVEHFEKKPWAKNVKGYLSPKKFEAGNLFKSIDLLIVDLEFQNKDSGLDLVERYLKKHSSKVVTLTSHNTPSLLLSLKNKGFNSYISKDESYDELDCVIEQILKLPHDNFFESNSFKRHIENYKKNTEKFFNTKKNNFLTLTEKRVKDLILKDSRLTNSQLSKKLKIRPNTLKTHITNIYQKINVKSKEGIVLYYNRES